MGDCTRNTAPTDAADAQARPCVGILGLGLIGGSFARAFSAAGWRVLAFDTDADTLAIARIDVLDGLLRREEDIAACDLIVLAAYPGVCMRWLSDHAPELGRAAAAARATQPDAGVAGPVVIDTAGVKAELCQHAFALAREHDFAFCGAHPMAGTEFSGFAHARADLFFGAPMVLTPPELADTERLDLLARVHDLLSPCGFGSFSVTSPREHDRLIAFTSQLAHVVSNAYVKSPTAQAHRGFSAGSYRDLTRVAHLNAPMWAELMMSDAAYLGKELDVLIGNLARVRDALAAGDAAELERLLAEGDRIKRALDDVPPARS